MKALCLTLTASPTSVDNYALGWRLIGLKGMKDFAAFSARKVKRAAAEERERDEYSSAEGQRGSKLEGKVIPASFLKIKGSRTIVGVIGPGE